MENTYVQVRSDEGLSKLVAGSDPLVEVVISGLPDSYPVMVDTVSSDHAHFYVPGPFMDSTNAILRWSVPKTSLSYNELRGSIRICPSSIDIKAILPLDGGYKSIRKRMEAKGFFHAEG